MKSLMSETNIKASGIPASVLHEISMLQLASPHFNILKYEKLLVDSQEGVHMLFEYGGESLIDFLSKRSVIL